MKYKTMFSYNLKKNNLNDLTFLPVININKVHTFMNFKNIFTIFQLKVEYLDDFIYCIKLYSLCLESFL